MEKALKYAHSHQEIFLNQLEEFLKIPSVSTRETHLEDMKKGAKYVQKHLEDMGVKTTIYETDGHPIVYGEWIQDENYPTFLIYGHYDVQPAEPFELWTTPAFEPTVRDGKLYARGATDDKGQSWIHIATLESFLKSKEPLYVNVKFLMEGEEEIGSPNLVPFFLKHQEMLKADALLVSDTAMIKKGSPSITCGIRGLVCLEVEVTAVSKDLHSGSYGGCVENPCHVLAKIIGKLQDENGRITIPGFYKQVRELSLEEREEIAKLPLKEDDLKELLHCTKLWGEVGYSPLERKSSRPTLDVNGMWGGYTEKGAKTIIPAKASAKISMRLVADQDPEMIQKQFIQYIKEITPDTVSLKITTDGTALPYLADTNHPYFEVAKKALAKAFESNEVVFSREGGSIPFIPVVANTLNIPCLLIGFGLPGQNTHSPDEWLSLDNFYRGIETMIYFFSSFPKV